MDLSPDELKQINCIRVKNPLLILILYREIFFKKSQITQ